MNFWRRSGLPVTNRTKSQYSATRITTSSQTHQCTNEIAAWQVIQKEIARYQSEKRGPTLLCAQTNLTGAILRQRLPIVRDFPCINITQHRTDTQFALFSWQKPAIKRMLVQYLNYSHWIKAQLQLAQQGQYPVVQSLDGSTAKDYRCGTWTATFGQRGSAVVVFVDAT